jgi:hypothetical protein
MKEGRAINDTHTKVIKKLLKDQNLKMMGANGSYRELENAVVNVSSLRKYKNNWGSETFIYEVEVVLDMRVKDSWFYSNRYCEKYKVRCNRYYRDKIRLTILDELKYFGVDLNLSLVEVKKITYKEIV